MRDPRTWLVILVLSAPIAAPTVASAATPENERIINSFMQLLIGDDAYAEQAFEIIDSEWSPGFAAMALDVLAVANPSDRYRRLLELLEAKTGQSFGYDTAAWWEWLWNEPEHVHPAYGDLKSALYALIDPAFRAYFSSDRRTEIRLDEIRWGGVHQDGIPPLRNPKMIDAADADYLDDDNVVFGLVVNGDARAYPKRILAWHEMFVDTVGGIPVAGVYCTLCGTMILYETEVDGTVHSLGTSGFLYRSNKLMYDRATQSLWNTIWGRPVVGPLTGTGIELESRAVVTTTWGAWRSRHPDTTVLSIDTGYERDYSEGAAYHDYFATDRLMFPVPMTDPRLKNKDEVFVLRPAGTDDPPLAIADAYLAAHPLYQDRLADTGIVVLTDTSGAHRAYVTEGTTFSEWDGQARVTDTDGAAWTVDESALVGSDGRSLPRYPAHRAFWFGWFAAYPQTRLVH